MTREEAIDNLKWLLDCNYVDSFEDAENEALEMAIKALEETCEDCISRQAVIDMAGLSEWFDSGDCYLEFVGALCGLPSVNPQDKVGYWIDEEYDNAMCSCCHRLNYWPGIYCKHCGARMKERAMDDDE